MGSSRHQCEIGHQFVVDFLVIVTAFALGLIGAIVLEHLAPKLGLIQPPNQRSSHTRPTARGGGLAIAVAIVISLIWLPLSGTLNLRAVALLTAIIAVLGFVDDLLDLPSMFRLLVQALVMSALIWASWPLPDIPLLVGVSISGVVLVSLLLICGLWWINLFNFMDGIDGIAGSQAVLLLFGGAGLWLLSASDAPTSSLFVASIAAAAATLGFLVRNWPPARIFMGDVGSNSLALFIFAFVLATISISAISYQSWLILPAAFVSDATVTLVRRVLRGELPWRAHRQHVYQHLSRSWGHLRVMMAYSALTLVWTFPLAIGAKFWPELSWWFVVVAYAPLIVAVILIVPDES